MSSWNSLSERDKQGILIFTGILVILLAIMIWYLVAASSIDIDRKTLCNKKAPSLNQYIYIIDVSDPLSERQRQRIKTRIETDINQSQINDRFTIYMLDEDVSGLPNAEIDLCRPKSSDEANSLYENKVFLAKDFSDRFMAPLDNATQVALKQQQQRISPIQEALSDISNHLESKPVSESQKIMLFSDMLQNTQYGSVYKNGDNAIKSLPKLVAPRLAITIYWLDRSSASGYQTPELAIAWANYLNNSGIDFEIKRVQE